MAKGDPVTSPYMALDAPDYTAVNRIQVWVDFDNTTRVISAVRTHRDQACMYHYVAVGVGPDGKPDSSPIKWPPPVGDYTSTPADLAWFNSVGVVTVEDFMGYQITATV